MSAFCGRCGAPQPQPSRFCVTCGAAMEAAAPGPAFVPTPVPARGAHRPALIAGGAALGLVTVVGGVLVATTLGADGTDLSATGSSQRQEVSAVTESPTESWTWSPDDSSTSLDIRADGDLVVVSDMDNEDVVRLDSNGTDLWHGDGVYVQGIDEAHGLVWVSTQWEGPGFAALDADTGEELWTQPDYTLSTQLADGAVWATSYDDSTETFEGAVIDEDGAIRWQTEGEQFEAVGDAVVSIIDDTVSVLDADTGDQRWSVQSDLEVDGDYGALSVTTTHELVVVSGLSGAEAYDLATGDLLWSETDLYDYSSFSSTGGSLVYAQLSGNTETYEDGQVDFFDSSGPVETLRLDPDDYFSPMLLPIDGKPYVADSNTGIIYDEALQPAGSFDGDLLPAADGFYQVFNGELSYQLLDGTEKWARQVADPDDYPQITPLDGRLLVTVDATVTGYE